MRRIVCVLVSLGIIWACGDTGAGDDGGSSASPDVLDADGSVEVDPGPEISALDASPDVSPTGEELPGDLAPEAVGPQLDLTVVALPDTQSYTAYQPDLFHLQTQWIVDNAAAEKIRFVTHLGDIVNSGDRPSEWEHARAAMQRLDDAGIPYGTCLGNHDTNDPGGYYKESTVSGCAEVPDEASCDGIAYLKNFGPAYYAGRPWYGGASPSGLSNYQHITVEGQELLFLHLAVDPWAAEIDWADGVLAEHPEAAVALSTHRYLFDFRMTPEMPQPMPLLRARRFDAFMYNFVQPLFIVGGWMAEKLFTDFVFTHPQIYMVQCGHIDAEYYQVSENSAGLPVHEILVDFQSLPPDGGNGWLRLLRYDLTAGRIHVQTWSPLLERFRENGEGCDYSVEVVMTYFDMVKGSLQNMPDYDVVEERLGYWTTTEEGREEFCALLYDQGLRDSDFSFDVDFAAYKAAP